MNDKDTQQKQCENNGQVYYKCSMCGVLHDGRNGMPTSCLKCDNDKFYKVTK